MFSLLISVMSVLPGWSFSNSISLPLSLSLISEILMSKSLFMSHDIMTTFWFWAELFLALLFLFL